MEVSIKDQMRYGEGDANFNEEHNRDVIANTIKKTSKRQEIKKKMWDEGLLERSDAVYSYLRHTALGGKSDTDIVNYLGKEYYLKLLGEERLRDIRKRASIPNISKLKSN
jgi:hypothetical protein